MPDLSANLVAHYRMDDNAASTVVIDSAASPTDGTSVRNTSLMHVDGKAGGALSFDGSNDYVSTTDYSTTFQAGFSVSFWAKPTDGQPAGTQTFCGINSPDSFYIFLTTAGKILAALISPTDITATTDAAVFSNGANNWKLITCVFNKLTTTTGNVAIYVNGELSKQGSNGSITWAGWSISGNLPIGAYLTMPATISAKFNGSIDDFKIFDKALSATEVSGLYNEIVPVNMNLSEDGTRLFSQR